MNLESLFIRDEQKKMQTGGSYDKERAVWLKLHEYAPQIADWDSRQAQQWYRQWEGSIPAEGCSCRKNYDKLEFEPDFSSAESFFESGVELHNIVNRKLDKPELTIEDAYTSFWHDPKPTSDLLVLAVGTNKYYNELSIVRPSHEHYAKKIGADYRTIVNGTQQWQRDKIRAGKIVPFYKRTIFLDSDVVIKPDCPNMFDLVPVDKVGMHNDWKYIARHEWLHKEKMAILGHTHNSCYNSGVVVCSRIANPWVDPGHDLPDTHCAEQFWVEDQAYKIGIVPLAREFNNQWWMSDFEEWNEHTHIVHFANDTERETSLPNAMRAYYYNLLPKDREQPASV